MDKNKLAIGLFFICIFSLIAGLVLPNKTPQKVINNNAKVSSNFLNSIENSGDKIALLNIEGVITGSTPRSYLSQEFNTYTFIDSLKNATKDNTVKVIIIRINSPGGTVAASQDIYDEVMRARTQKPIIVSMGDVAASGGYYISSAADRIVAQKGTMTGSIGVIMNFTDIAKLTDKIGISSNVIKSGKFKDSGSMYRKMTTDEQNLFQNSVNTAYGQFTQAITQGRINRNDEYNVERRNLTKETLKNYADGRVFLGEEAYNLGFVDALGSMNEAEIIANKIVNASKPLSVVDYNKVSSFKSILMGLEGKFFNPMKDALPFSYTHNSLPLMIWEK